MFTIYSTDLSLFRDSFIVVFENCSFLNAFIIPLLSPVTYVFSDIKIIVLLHIYIKIRKNNIYEQFQIFSIYIHFLHLALSDSKLVVREISKYTLSSSLLIESHPEKYLLSASSIPVIYQNILTGAVSNQLLPD